MNIKINLKSLLSWDIDVNAQQTPEINVINASGT